MTGIYFLFLDKQLVYIGKTTNYPSRVMQHKDKHFNRMRFIECDTKNLDNYERRLIKLFKPLFNKCLTEGVKVSTNLRINPELAKRVKSCAEAAKRSMNKEIELALEEKFA